MEFPRGINSTEIDTFFTYTFQNPVMSLLTMVYG